MTPSETLEALKVAEVRHLPLASLQTDPALQPRETRLIPFRDQGRAESRSHEHIGTMRLALEGSQVIELEPVLVADIDGELLVIDGHHRLKAYSLALRETIPARVCPMKHREAVLASKLVNISARALEMHREQRADAAWQYLAEVTRMGAGGLPKGASLRTVAGLFGIGKDTVATMLRRLPKVNAKDYAEASFDPGTQFPRWRYVREAGAGWQDMESKMSPEQLTQHEAEKLAKRLGALIDKASPAAVRRALEMMANEAKLAAGNADTLAFLAEIAEPSSDDF